MPPYLTLATYNIHKGLSAFGRRFILHELKQALNGLNPDVVFLQEVQGSGRRLTYQSQYEFLAKDGSYTTAYGLNATCQNTHHGNALISLHPILKWQNHDISLNRFEKRGVLHCQIQLPGADTSFHALCVHLNLLGRDRRKQIQRLIEYIDIHVPSTAPLIIAGDFNDWRVEISPVLAQHLQVQEVFESLIGKPARSFPARLPLLALDRIYTRGFSVQEGQVLTGTPWNKLSDHAPLTVKLQLLHSS